MEKYQSREKVVRVNFRRLTWVPQSVQRTKKIHHRHPVLVAYKKELQIINRAAAPKRLNYTNKKIAFFTNKNKKEDKQKNCFFHNSFLGKFAFFTKSGLKLSKSGLKLICEKKSLKKYCGII